MNFRPFWIAGCCALLAMMASPSAVASLTYDLRVVGGADAKTAYVTSTGQMVTMELWAVVKGSGAELEGFQFGFGSVLSSDGGNIKGNLSATLIAPFNATGSQSGTPTNLDSDGDLDLGSNGLTAIGDPTFFDARAGSMITAGNPIANGQEFKLATIRFTVSSIGTALDFTPIQVNFRVTDFTNGVENEALWQEDGIMKSSNGGGTLASVGTAVMIAVPEPSSWLLLASGGVGWAAYRPRRK